MKNKKVIIIGAGPGGLTAGMILAKRGFDVSIFEKRNVPGGRNSSFTKNGFTFDVGPTFLMMKYILDEVFELAGQKAEDYLKFTRLSPMYRLYYEDNHLDVYEEKAKMKKEIERVFPEDASGLEKFIEKESKRFERVVPCLEKDYSSFFDYFSKPVLLGLPYFSLGKTLYSVLGDYFKNPKTRIAFTFQSKYLGMSPWKCPGAFGIIPFIEHSMGIYHVEGGLSKISDAMAELVKKNGGKINYNKEVKEIIFKDKEAKGIELKNGKKYFADSVVINADFAHAMTSLFPKNTVKYTKNKVEKKEYSCSTFMMYLGLNKKVNLKHHSIFFAKNYKKNVDQLFKKGNFSTDDISFYVRNSGITDKVVVPKGKSQLYFLIPVPNKKIGDKINWKTLGSKIKKTVLKTLKERTGLDIEKDIISETYVSPNEWQKDYDVFFGAVFNLSHKLRQMLWLRPHNELESVKNCYLVGGGTHPGSGLPTIYESGRITAELIDKKFKK